MRKLTYFVASTLDGFIADPSGADPMGVEGFFVPQGGHIDALIADYPEILPFMVHKALGITPENTTFDTVIEGRVSYELGLKAGITNAYPHLRHYVFSASLGESPDSGVDIVRTDPVATVRELKTQPGKDMWLVGGATLANTLRDEIDELKIKLHPVVAGAGIPLFQGEFRLQQYRLTEHQAFDSGVVHLTYTRN